MQIRLALAALTLCLVNTVAFAATPMSDASHSKSAAAAAAQPAANPADAPAIATTKHKPRSVKHPVKCAAGQTMVNGKCEKK